MTTLMPCNNCGKRKRCDLRATKQKLLRGTGMTVAKFSCPILTEEYRKGRRVSVRLVCGHEDYSTVATFVGTVMRWKGRRLMIHLDTGESANGYAANKRIVTAWPEQVDPRDEADREMCICGLPKGATVDDWHCESCYPLFAPTPADCA